jgi:hypothetical protein
MSYAFLTHPNYPIKIARLYYRFNQAVNSLIKQAINRIAKEMGINTPREMVGGFELSLKYWWINFDFLEVFKNEMMIYDITLTEFTITSPDTVIKNSFTTECLAILDSLREVLLLTGKLRTSFMRELINIWFENFSNTSRLKIVQEEALRKIDEIQEYISGDSSEIQSTEQLQSVDPDKIFDNDYWEREYQREVKKSNSREFKPRKFSI